MLTVIKRTEWRDMLTIQQDGVEKVGVKVDDGNMRDVYLFDDVVVKFGGAMPGQNLNELDFYTTLDEGDAPYFARILDYGEFNGEMYLVQERAYDTGEEPTAEQIAKANELIDKYEMENDVWFTNGNFWGDERKNCLLTNEGVKFYDFGWTRKRQYGARGEGV